MSKSKKFVGRVLSEIMDLSKTEINKKQDQMETLSVEDIRAMIPKEEIKVSNIKWVTSGDIDNQSLSASWDPVENCSNYSISLINENGDICFTDTTNNTSYDFTDVVAQYTSGGKYTFTVQPKIEGIDTISNESGKLTVLARPNETALRWEGTKAVWNKIEGASFYLLDLLSENNRSLSDMGYSYPRYGLAVHGKYVLVQASGNIEESVEVGSLFNDMGDGMKFGVLAYSDATYTPQYEWPIGKYYNPF